MHTPWRYCKYDLREVAQHFMCHSSRYTSKWSFHHQRCWKMDMKLPENNGPSSTPNGIQWLIIMFTILMAIFEREAKIRVLECQVFSPPYVQPGV